MLKRPYLAKTIRVTFFKKRIAAVLYISDIETKTVKLMNDLTIWSMSPFVKHPSAGFIAWDEPNNRTFHTWAHHAKCFASHFVTVREGKDLIGRVAALTIENTEIDATAFVFCQSIETERRMRITDLVDYLNSKKEPFKLRSSNCNDDDDIRNYVLTSP